MFSIFGHDGAVWHVKDGLVQRLAENSLELRTGKLVNRETNWPQQGMNRENRGRSELVVDVAKGTHRLA
jgi:hypothetical protein